MQVYANLGQVDQQSHAVHLQKSFEWSWLVKDILLVKLVKKPCGETSTPAFLFAYILESIDAFGYT